MDVSLIVAFSLLACTANGISKYSFPDNFTFGVGSSAYQIEGAWTEDGKGVNIWDYAIHNNPSIIEDGKNADDADQSFYGYFSEDIDALKQLNVTHYKISIAWSRVFPEGIFMNDTEVNRGLGHYQNQINDLINNGITPIVTLYHWDLPEIIQDWGGWTNESNIDIFVDYARQAFTYLYNVKYFITFNEPKQICKSGYGDGTLAPFISQSGVLDYKCAYVVLKAHAAVYKMYQEEFADKMEAKISIALDGSWSQPNSDSDADKEAAERRNQFEFGLYANPIFNGDWPQKVKDRVTTRSKAEKLTRLPEFTDEEIKEIKGSVDFMSINFFDTRLVSDTTEAPYGTPAYDKDLRANVSRDPSWSVDAVGNTIVPSSIRSFLKYVKDNYGDPDILITGNGVADNNGTTDDGHRISYLSEYLSNVVDAIHEDNVKVFGYTYWSLLDSFEWTKGYTCHFGLFVVKIDESTTESVTRIPKRSVSYYKTIIQEKKVVDPGEITTTTTNDSPVTVPHRTTTLSPEPSTRPSSTAKLMSSKILLTLLIIKLALF